MIDAAHDEDERASQSCYREEAQRRTEKWRLFLVLRWPEVGFLHQEHTEGMSLPSRVENLCRHHIRLSPELSLEPISVATVWMLAHAQLI